MSENTDNPPTVELGPVLQNCWTCLNDQVEAEGYHVCLSLKLGPCPVAEWVDEHVAHRGDGESMPAHDAPACPGWKPKPEPSFSAHVVEVLGLDFSEVPTTPAEQANTDREQLAALGSVPPPEPTIPEVVEALEDMTADTITIKRAAWDALLADIAAMESRVGDLERRQRTDNARAQALRRRERNRRTR